MFEAGNCPLRLKYMSTIGENRSLGILDTREWANIYKPQETKKKIPILLIGVNDFQCIKLFEIFFHRN